MIPGNNQKGFSLIEAMVALVIFVIGILGAYTLQIYATQGSALANRVSVASSWASYAIEDLLDQDYDDFVDNTSDGYAGLDDRPEPPIGLIPDESLYVNADGSTTATASPDALYSIHWNVAEGTSSETAVFRDVKQIRIHVVRNGGIGDGLLYSHDYFKTEDVD